MRPKTRWPANVDLPASLLDVPAVAELLGVRPRWVYEHLDELPHVRVGRYVRFEPAFHTRVHRAAAAETRE